ncbi:MAG: COX15/CtaA family protein [Cyclobacteriaceae bacterium]|nr:COX15/CtaA family protein [Cyclobacteriaceae bacterium]
MLEKYKKIIFYWLATGAALVLLMVVIGGITRLTHSGLSMVDWKPISGIIPPLNEVQWQQEFKNYQQYPEYQKVNQHFTLEDFKSIFWWEYIHRALGRIIGMVFIFPFLFFIYKKAFDKKWLKHLLILLAMGGLQGFIGWFMVKSGLKDQPAVSHYRLAIHLCAALGVYTYIIYLMIKIKTPKLIENIQVKTKAKKWALISLFLIVIQIIYGAFVAGLKAGLIFNTWPKMGNVWISPVVYEKLSSMGFLSIFDEPVTVQFIHRIIPYLILIPVFYLFKIKDPIVRKQTYYLGGFWLLQVFLGVTTLLFGVPVWLGVMHQLGAVALLSASLILLFKIQGETST